MTLSSAPWEPPCLMFFPASPGLWLYSQCPAGGPEGAPEGMLLPMARTSLKPRTQNLLGSSTPRYEFRLHLSAVQVVNCWEIGSTGSQLWQTQSQWRPYRGTQTREDKLTSRKGRHFEGGYFQVGGQPRQGTWLRTTFSNDDVSTGLSLSESREEKDACLSCV